MSSAVEHDIHSDGRTVWINGPTQLLGRFGPFGIDVHMNGVCAGDGCVPGRTDRNSWDKFKTTMLEVHGVRVGDHHMPHYLRETDG